jgi:hypothetical protein
MNSKLLVLQKIVQKKSHSRNPKHVMLPFTATKSVTGREILIALDTHDTKQLFKRLVHVDRFGFA